MHVIQNTVQQFKKESRTIQRETSLQLLTGLLIEKKIKFNKTYSEFPFIFKIKQQQK